jgi:type II secretory pathway pseudopilin PulG
MQLKNSQRSGFTLLELVIALGIFMIFMGAIMNSFIAITSAQQKANLSREGISEAKEILNFISVEGREKRIDYFCNTGLSSTNNGSQEAEFEARNAFSLSCQIDLQTTKLVLINNDGLERILISADLIPDSTFIQVSSIKQTRTSIFSNWQEVETIPLHSNRLKVRDFQVKISPTTDPYNLENSQTLEHPIAQIILAVERNSQKPNQSAEPIVIQTSIASRAYNPQEL